MIITVNRIGNRGIDLILILGSHGLDGGVLGFQNIDECAEGRDLSLGPLGIADTFIESIHGLGHGIGGRRCSLLGCGQVDDFLIQRGNGLLNLVKGCILQALTTCR